MGDSVGTAAEFAAAVDLHRTSWPVEEPRAFRRKTDYETACLRCLKEVRMNSWTLVVAEKAADVVARSAAVGTTVADAAVVAVLEVFVGETLLVDRDQTLSPWTRCFS